MKCPYCNHTITYLLKTGQKKCAKCKRKFSMKMIEKDYDIVKRFCDDTNAFQTAKELNLNYLTVKKRYDLFRILIVKYLEKIYNQNQTEEYDEYIYLPKSKKKIKENIFDAQNFLTFSYGDTKVYNLLMPNLKRYKREFLNDGLEDAYFNEFSKFMMFNKIAKTTKRDNTITRFWNFFEDSILKYKGIDNENFIYYLKEFEFKFNHTKKETYAILDDIYKKNTN